MQNEFEYEPTHIANNEVGATATIHSLVNVEIEASGPRDLIAPSEIITGDTEYVLARDIQIDPSVHERRSFSDDDLERAKAVASQSHLIAPFPVIKRGSALLLLDGYVTLQAVIALDVAARVKVYKVDHEDIAAVRLGDTRRRSNREAMAPARQALARSRSGRTQDEIAKELAFSPGNVSQMVSAAEVEEECEALANLIIGRSKLSRGFWYDLHTTRERLRKADEANGDGRTPATDRFATAIADMIAAGEPVTAAQVRKALGVNVRCSEPKRRNRMLGKPVERPGLTVRISVNKRRQGGPVINFPPGFPVKDFDAALEALLAFLMGPPPAGDQGPQD